MTLSEIERAAWEAAQQRDLELRSDPGRRRAQGIVHTPPELARGVVLVLDELLRERFGFAAGICDERVHAIDHRLPARQEQAGRQRRPRHRAGQ